MIWGLLLISVAGAVWPAQAQAARVGVIYPRISEPYAGVFQQIIQGVEQATDDRVITRAVSDDETLDGLAGWLEEQRITRVIALGRRGMTAVEQLSPAVPAVVGAVLLPPGASAGVPGVTLAPHPDNMFDRLLRLSPSSRRVFVVYNPEENASLMSLARTAAQRREITLELFTAEDQREAVMHYREIVNRHVRPGDAIWLPQDAVTVNETVILPMLLEKAWAHQVLVFSSNPAHVRRGALFSLYPDNVAMGRRLANMVEERAAGNNSSVLEPLVDLRAAINIRTADHLRLGVQRQDLREYDLVFPSP